MTGKNIIKYIENWAPKEIAWVKDNVGLQVGSPNKKVKNILISLDLTNNVVDDAIKKNCNFIITHHPLLFRPLKKIDLQNDNNSILIERIIKNDITIYSAHTNLDYVKDGVSYQLAKRLQLSGLNFLVRLKSNQSKLIVYVPHEFSSKVSDAIFEAGGGIIGEYSNCSYKSSGVGTFIGSSKTHPKVGQNEVLQNVNEMKLEIIIDNWQLNNAISSMIKAHPYEEPAYDVIQLGNDNPRFGIGAVGILEKPLNPQEFLNFVSEKLRIKNFRYNGGIKKSISKVAVCGGSGAEYINDAIKNNADAYITADIKYHTFQDYKNDILLIDAGHYETEVVSLDEIKRRLTLYKKANNSSIKIFKYKGSTNPVKFFNN